MISKRQFLTWIDRWRCLTQSMILALTKLSMVLGLNHRCKQYYIDHPNSLLCTNIESLHLLALCLTPCLWSPGTIAYQLRCTNQTWYMVIVGAVWTQLQREYSQLPLMLHYLCSLLRNILVEVYPRQFLQHQSTCSSLIFAHDLKNLMLLFGRCPVHQIVTLKLTTIGLASFSFVFSFVLSWIVVFINWVLEAH